ncbi:MAG: hypothetical protein K2F92_05925, partial [Alistipes sp.]|nr:hypothetical protein [Alistipes sp.]
LLKYISVLLLVVYLLATGGGAYASISCRCATEAHAHACVASHDCHACGDHGACVRCVDDAAAEELCATCMCDRHSTEIALYTATTDDSVHSVRCAVLALPHCLAVAQAARLSAPKFHKERIYTPAVPILQAPYLCVAGLRAPPVLV